MADKIKKIVVAIDLRKASDPALKRGLQLAKKFNAKLTIVHINADKNLETWWKNLLPPLRRTLLTPSEQIKAKITASFAKAERNKIERIEIIQSDAPVKKILAFTKKINADLLVIGTHNKYTFRDWLKPTKAEYLAQKISCPLLIVKTTGLRDYKNILVALDYSNASTAAVKTAAHWFPHARFSMVNVGDTAYEDLINDQTYAKHKLKNDLLKILSAKIKDFVTALKLKLKKTTYHVEIGSPGLVILKHTNQPRYNLVVIGTQGHSKVYYDWLGSVASYLLSYVNKDILLIPPQKSRVARATPEQKFIKKMTLLTEEHFEDLKKLSRAKKDTPLV